MVIAIKPEVIKNVYNVWEGFFERFAEKSSVLGYYKQISVLFLLQ